MTPDKTLEEMAAHVAGAILSPHYDTYTKHYYEDIDRAARFITKAISEATAAQLSENARLKSQLADALKVTTEATIEHVKNKAR